MSYLELKKLHHLKKQKMQKILLIFMFLCGFAPVNAQHARCSTKLIKESSSYQYYIYLSGINRRSDVLTLEKTVQAKPNVTFFMADRFPVRCFILKSTIAISKNDFESWINPALYHIEVFGSDDKDKELAYTLYIKNKKNNHE